ncbi:MAG TPA: MarC family protein [Gemmatimonadaceae bacterium]|jgi:multiple antibiotic resistance protein
MSSYLQFTLVTFTSLLFIVDPVAVIPTYLVITQGNSVERRRRTALRACIAAGLLMTVFGVAGNAIFHIFGITLPAFRIAGGFILWLVALDMLRGERTTQESTEEIVEGQEKEDVALTPLAMPMLAGPGAISTVMVLAGQARGVPGHIAVYGSIWVTAIICWLTLRAGDRLVTLLGQTGIRVMTRIMGLLLAAVATQFVITGALEALRP